VRKYDVQLIPVDSEHSAIFQCLTGQADHAIRRIVLTASGGPFRNTDKRTMDRATVEEALNHPTWKMGPKISIDSATMMNKALEIIEAHWLFGLTSRQIEVIIHPQSVAHSFVEFEDNSVLAQLGPPDMQTPIQYALTYPDRPVGCSRSLYWSTLKTLVFEPPDHDRFTSLKLAYDVIDAGGTSGAVFNGANEAAVEAFLGRRIRFGRIAELVADALSALDAKPVDSLDTVLEADRAARRYVTQQLKASRKA
jgi:1-deoxy-D-xylulose-5-phosphate reductoisomerase